MAIAYRSSSVGSSGSAANITVTAPSGIQDNDILIAVLYKENTAAVTATGWTAIHTISPAGDHRHYVWYKRAASESGNYTFSWTGSTYRNAAIIVYSGCETTGDPQSVTASTNSATSGQTLTHNTITTADADCMIIGIGSHFNAAAGTWSNSSSMTERVDANNLMIMEVAQAGAGATGNKTSATSDVSESWGASLIALKPPAAAGHPAGRRLGLARGFRPVEIGRRGALVA